MIDAGIPQSDIFDYTGDKLAFEYQRYLDWCLDNLKDYGERFNTKPSFFFFWDSLEINAQAGFGYSGVYVIRFSKGFMSALHKKLGIKGAFFGKTDWTAFHTLQKNLPVSLEYLMFQASVIFTFYHEYAHLVQKQGEAFFMNEYPKNGTFSFQRHVREYDADLNGCQFVAFYMMQYIQDHVPTHLHNDNTYRRILYLGISSIVITFILLLNGELYPFKPDVLDTSFYTKETTHPHTFTRTIYTIEHFVGIAKSNNMPIDYADTVRNVTVICNEFFKDNPVFKDFINGLNKNFEAIKIYTSELYIGQHKDKHCIKHRAKLFQ